MRSSDHHRPDQGARGYKSKAPAKELEELKKHVAQAEASTTTVIERLRVQVDDLQMELRACVGPLGL